MANKIPVRRHDNYDYHRDNRMPMSDDARRNATLLAVVGVAATAAAVYLLSGERGRHNREQLKHWLEEARDEVTTRASKLKNVDPQAVRSIVDAVFGKAGGMDDEGTSTRSYRRSMRSDEIE